MQTRKQNCLLWHKCTEHKFIRVPGEVGRLLVQTYFEAEHSNTAVIHPEDNSPVSPPEPVKRPRRTAHRTAPRRNPQNPLSGAFQYNASQYGSRPPYGLIHRAAAPPLRQQSRRSQVNGTAPERYGQNLAAGQHRFYPNLATAQINGSAPHPLMHGQHAPFFRY